jgi:hypothetical protein
VGRCQPAQILSQREQTGYTWAVVSASIGLLADFVAVLFLTSERQRRRRR